jgi:hypothetical protein
LFQHGNASCCLSNAGEATEPLRRAECVSDLGQFDELVK